MVIFVLSVGIITIMQAVTRTTNYISETAQRTIALNLAKEGIEAVYNIRNTNWRRRSSQRNACWLKANPMENENNNGCENDGRIRAGRGIPRIEEREGQSYTKIMQISAFEVYNQQVKDPALRTCGSYEVWDTFEKAKKWMVDWVIPNVNNPRDGHRLYQLHFVDGQWIDQRAYEAYNAKNGKAPQVDASKGKYLRFVRIDGLYPKNDPDPNQCLFCTKGSDRTTIADPALCGGNEAKELRFCSVVMYWKPYRGMVEICSMMTNFLE